MTHASSETFCGDLLSVCFLVNRPFNIDHECSGPGIYSDMNKQSGETFNNLKSKGFSASSLSTAYPTLSRKPYRTFTTPFEQTFKREG